MQIIRCYRLQQFEGGLYYLQRVGYPNEDGATSAARFNSRIGWTDKGNLR